MTSVSSAGPSSPVFSPESKTSEAMEELKKSGLSHIEYPKELRGAVERAVASWKEFCALTPEEKKKFAFVEDEHGDGSGYELKTEKGVAKDKKENFHVTLHQYDRLEKIAAGKPLPFLTDAIALLDGLESIVSQYAEQLQEEFKIDDLAEVVIRSKSSWILRYLHYFEGQREGSEIALPHADKGGLTLHLYESDEGLQRYSIHTPQWEPVDLTKNQTIIFPGLQLQLLSNNRLKGLYHRVVATPQTAQQGRFSMVCFIPFEGIPKYDKSRLGSVQTQDVAFNYNMPYREFEELFVAK